MLERIIKKLINVSEPSFLGILKDARPSNKDTLMDKLLGLVQ
jgi:hypothetical protein